MSRSADRYHHGNLRPVLTQAALDILDAEGKSTVSLRAVARRAGVSHNAPYHHFRDRADLLAAAGQEAMRQFIQVQKAAYAEATGPSAALVAAGAAYVRWAAAHPGAFEVIYDPEICPPGNPSPQMGPLIAENEKLLSDALAVARPDLVGTPAQQPTEAAMWATVHGLAVLVSGHHLPDAAIEPALKATLGLLPSTSG